MLNRKKKGAMKEADSCATIASGESKIMKKR